MVKNLSHKEFEKVKPVRFERSDNDVAFKQFLFSVVLKASFKTTCDMTKLSLKTGHAVIHVVSFLLVITIVTASRRLFSFKTILTVSVNLH